MAAETIVEAKTAANVEEAVPFFGIANMETSLRFYVEGLGFEMTQKWIVDGRIRWCRLMHGGAAIMLQEFLQERMPSGTLGEGMSVSFNCKDSLAIYREAKVRGLQVQRPFVGNAMWVVNLSDPDGHRISFQSPTDAPEESELSES